TAWAGAFVPATATGQSGVLAAHSRHLPRRLEPQGLPDVLLDGFQPDLLAGDPTAENSPACDERGRRTGNNLNQEFSIPPAPLRGEGWGEGRFYITPQNDSGTPKARSNRPRHLSLHRIRHSGFARRTASTSQGAPCRMSFAVDPSNKARPWRPWLPTTIRSQPCSRARRCTSWRGWP